MVGVSMAVRERRALRVEGVVQGVGFRPFVHTLATSLGLAGWVRNDDGSVHIEVEGEPEVLDRFRLELLAGAPAPARVERARESTAIPRGEAGFRIEPSVSAGAPEAGLCPDLAVCDECVREVLDPRERRYRYAFAHCARCGPRYAVATALPYDRARTTMASFVPCGACRREYEDPRDRRFHAQTVACPACGPRMRVLSSSGDEIACDDPIAFAAREIARGSIVALKGFGGYHLACDARNESAVAALRARKNRGGKPFAVMLADRTEAARYCEIEGVYVSGAEALASPARPVVIFPRRAPDGDGLAPSVAPGRADLGVLLPYAPAHHVLVRDLNGAPLVMTSGNRGDEPIACDDAEALEKLAGIADFFLAHDREVRRRCDDSVLRAVPARVAPVRRARGYTPQGISMTRALASPTLAVGGHGKAAAALGRGAIALVGAHVGDLGGYDTEVEFAVAVRRHEELFGVFPTRIAHDLHPDYASTRYARERASREGLELVPVQHHHAHMAGCLAEHGVDGTALGVVFDGAGLGWDGKVWGGEFFFGTAGSVRRVGHLSYVAMPGGERAAREPWRMAVAHALACGESGVLDALRARVGREWVRGVETLVARGLNAPGTSSAGRLFDAVASIAGVCDHAGYEGDAASRLEALAREAAGEAGWYDAAVRESAAGDTPGGTVLVVDAGDMVRGAARDASRGVGAAVIARRFHRGLARAVARVAVAVAAREKFGIVALSGGVFVNAVLADDVEEALAREGFGVLRHARVPCNDGGLSFGQLAVTAARDSVGAVGRV